MSKWFTEDDINLWNKAYKTRKQEQFLLNNKEFLVAKINL